MKNILLIFTLLMAPIYAVDAYPVAYNVNKKIYHSINCEWAHKCTKSCIVIDHKDAIRRGGRPCKICHGK